MVEIEPVRVGPDIGKHAVIMTGNGGELQKACATGIDQKETIDGARHVCGYPDRHLARERLCVAHAVGRYTISEQLACLRMHCPHFQELGVDPNNDPLSLLLIPASQCGHLPVGCLTSGLRLQAAREIRYEAGKQREDAAEQTTPISEQLINC